MHASDALARSGQRAAEDEARAASHGPDRHGPRSRGAPGHDESEDGSRGKRGGATDEEAGREARRIACVVIEAETVVVAGVLSVAVRIAPVSPADRAHAEIAAGGQREDARSAQRIARDPTGRCSARRRLLVRALRVMVGRSSFGGRRNSIELEPRKRHRATPWSVLDGEHLRGGHASRCGQLDPMPAWVRGQRGAERGSADDHAVEAHLEAFRDVTVVVGRHLQGHVAEPRLERRRVRTCVRATFGLARAGGLRRGVRVFDPRRCGAAFVLVTQREVEQRAEPGIETIAVGELRTRFGIAARLHQPACFLELRLGERAIERRFASCARRRCEGRDHHHARGCASDQGQCHPFVRVASQEVATIMLAARMASETRESARNALDDTAALSTVAPACIEDEPLAGLPAPGSLVVRGKYRIERLVGMGGMGAVFAATHTQLGHRVALKLLLPQVSRENPHARDRFLREARAAVRIVSDHVARVIDVGVLEGDIAYMVMDYLEGVDLAVHLRERAPAPAPVAFAVEVVLHACEALAAAHVRRIVHRDIKPSNIFLVAREDESVSVKILDFGISKVERSDEAPKSITNPGGVLGSPRYMSPEQVRSSKDVDHRTDIWSVGLVLYEILAGRPMFDHASFSAQCAAIVADDVSLRLERPDVDPALEAIIARCLAKNAEDRFEDVAELAAALAPFAPDGASSARRTARILGRPAQVAVRTSSPPPLVEGARPSDAPFSRTLHEEERTRRPEESRWRTSKLAVFAMIAPLLAGAAVMSTRAPKEAHPAGRELAMSALASPATLPAEPMLPAPQAATLRAEPKAAASVATPAQPTSRPTVHRSMRASTPAASAKVAAPTTPRPTADAEDLNLWLLRERR